MNREKRPLAVTLLVLIVLTLATAQLLRALVALSAFNFYSGLLGGSFPLFFLLSGIAWGVLGVWLAGGLWRGATWAANTARWGLAAYFVVSWVDRIFLQSSGPQTTPWAFQLAANVLLLITIFAALALPHTQTYFGEKK